MKKTSSTCLMVSIFLLPFITSCDKEPASDFTIDKQEYAYGEMVYATNAAKDGYSYHWTTSASDEEATTKDFQFTPVYEGEQSVTLSVWSKNKKKVDHFSRFFTLTKKRAKFLFYTKNTAVDNIQIFINGHYMGTITEAFPASEPDCNARGCVTLLLAEGDYQVSYSEPGGLSYSATVKFSVAGSCNKVKVF